MITKKPKELSIKHFCYHNYIVNILNNLSLNDSCLLFNDVLVLLSYISVLNPELLNNVVQQCKEHAKEFFYSILLFLWGVLIVKQDVHFLNQTF